MESVTAIELTCAELLKVLADETRLAVMRQLLGGPKHVSQINEELGVEQSLLSHHMKVLRDAGLVIAQRDGKAVLYQLAPRFESLHAEMRFTWDVANCRLTNDL